MSKTRGYVPNVKFGGTENILDVLMKCANYCDDGFIAVIHNSAGIWIPMANIQCNFPTTALIVPLPNFHFYSSLKKHFGENIGLKLA